MWSSKADANCYTNSIIVAFSCSRRFIASHDLINHAKSPEFLKFKEEISAAALAEPEDLVCKTAGVNFRRSLSPAAGEQLPSPTGHINVGIPQVGLTISSIVSSLLTQHLCVQFKTKVAGCLSQWYKQKVSRRPPGPDRSLLPVLPLLQCHNFSSRGQEPLF